MRKRACLGRHQARVGLCVGSNVTVRTLGWIWGPKRQEPLETQARLRPATSCGSESFGRCRGSRLIAGLTAALHGRSSQPMMSASGVSHTSAPPSRAFDTTFSSLPPSLNFLIRSRISFWASLRASRAHREASMAEILGAVASGLAVAEVGLKVGGTVWKLKRLWQEVHEVPETIAYLMKEIEIIEPVLSEFEGNFNAQIIAFPTESSAYNGAPTALSSAYCREALNDLRSLVEDLDRAVTSEKKRKRTVARIRVVLKEDTIKKFQGRLERATRLLQSAQVNYLT